VDTGSHEPGNGDVGLDAALAMIEHDQAMTGLGIQLAELAPGNCAVSMTVTPAMLNGHGTCHGGYIFLLADAAFGAACNSDAGGLQAVASSCDITFIAPGRPGDVLQAHATRRLIFGRSALYDVTVRRQDGTVLAEFRGHSRSRASEGQGRLSKNSI
jgi:acyl-CoA thioesterase